MSERSEPAEVIEPAQPAAVACDLLAWYRAMGVDEALEEAAVDWLSRPDEPPGNAFRLAGGGPPSVASDAARPSQSQAGGQDRSPAPSRPTATAAAPLAGAPLPPRGGQAKAGASPAGGSLQGITGAAGRQFPTASPDEALTAAREVARRAPTLEALREGLEAFDGCALKATAKNLCFYRGARRARLMIIGEAPGRDEDLSGQPFVGPAGRLLDRMLAAIGLGDGDVHVTNTVYWRPPGNRTPSPQETQVCRPFLDRQIELVEPEVIALLGGAAANQVLGMPGGIMRLRGTWREIEHGGRRIRVMPSLHPAYLLRTPLQKRLAWRDMLAIAEALAGGAKPH